MKPLRAPGHDTGLTVLEVVLAASILGLFLTMVFGLVFTTGELKIRIERTGGPIP